MAPAIGPAKRESSKCGFLQRFLIIIICSTVQSGSPKAEALYFQRVLQGPSGSKSHAPEGQSFENIVFSDLPTGL